jgi:K(+)-stimulated pyrophosphate-energized sodium pump
MAGTSRPDYARAVDLTAKASLRAMIAPGLLAVGMPIVVGLVFRYGVSELHATEVQVGGVVLEDSSGWLAVSGLLIVGTIVGIIVATFLNNGGGAWDNAKKFIEADQLTDDAGVVQGKGTATHAAAVVGDTVGDPFKDTAGPSLHVLVKLLATITLVLAPIFVA